MAQIVLGIATSHGPMLSTPPEEWGQRVTDDMRLEHPFRGEVLSYNGLLERRRTLGRLVEVDLQTWRRRHAACRGAIAHLAKVFRAAHIDAAVILGNDQMECFTETLFPAFAVLWGDIVTNSPYPPERLAALPPGIAISVAGHIPPGGAEYPAAAQLGLHLISSATRAGFDVAAMRKMPNAETPHAFGFVYRQIMADHPVPSVPVLINTYYPPNQPTLQRCAQWGRFLVDAITSWKSPARVALIASGGMSHFAIDEEFDRGLIQKLLKHDITAITELDERNFQSGTSEVKSWVPLAAAMAQLGLPGQLIDYVPCYRTPAGTGTAQGFMAWRARR